LPHARYRSKCIFLLNIIIIIFSNLNNVKIQSYYAQIVIDYLLYVFTDEARRLGYSQSKTEVLLQKYFLFRQIYVRRLRPNCLVCSSWAKCTAKDEHGVLPSVNIVTRISSYNYLFIYINI